MEKRFSLKTITKKATAIKRFQNSPLGKGFKKLTSVKEKQYQEFQSNKREEKVKRRCAKSILVYDNYFTFFKLCNNKEFVKRSPNLNLNELNKFKGELELICRGTEEIRPFKEGQKKDLEDRKSKINAASNLHDNLLNIYTADYNKLTENQKKTINVLKRPENLTLGFTEDD